MDDLFALMVDEDQLASDGLEALFDIPARERGQGESTRGHTPETTPGLTAGPSTAAQTPRDGADVDGLGDSQSDGAVQDADAGATPHAQDGQAEVCCRCGLVYASSDAVGGTQTWHSRPQTAPISLDSPLARGAQSPPTGGPEALTAATGCRKRRADDGDKEEGRTQEVRAREPGVLNGTLIRVTGPKATAGGCKHPACREHHLAT